MGANLSQKSSQNGSIRIRKRDTVVHRLELRLQRKFMDDDPVQCLLPYDVRSTQTRGSGVVVLIVGGCDESGRRTFYSSCLSCFTKQPAKQTYEKMAAQIKQGVMTLAKFIAEDKKLLCQVSGKTAQVMEVVERLRWKKNYPISLLEEADVLMDDPIVSEIALMNAPLDSGTFWLMQNIQKSLKQRFTFDDNYPLDESYPSLEELLHVRLGTEINGFCSQMLMTIGCELQADFRVDFTRRQDVEDTVRLPQDFASHIFFLCDISAFNVNIKSAESGATNAIRSTLDRWEQLNHSLIRSAQFIIVFSKFDMLLQKIGASLIPDSEQTGVPCILRGEKFSDLPKIKLLSCWIDSLKEQFKQKAILGVRDKLKFEIGTMSKPFIAPNILLKTLSLRSLNCLDVEGLFGVMSSQRREPEKIIKRMVEYNGGFSES